RKAQRAMLNRILAGLGDLSTNFLPLRDFRRGEVWNLSEAADVKAGIEDVIRFIAQRNLTHEGFPPMTIAAKVPAKDPETKPWAPPSSSEVPPAPGEAPAAPATPAAPAAPAAPSETHEPESCVRLDLFITAEMEGDTNEARLGPGRISTAARTSGPLW